jgi:hypothetical protein
MIAKAVVTAVLVALAINAFLIDALGAGSHVNPFGVLFWFLAIVNWYAWDTMKAGWASRRDMDRDSTDLPLLFRFGTVYMKGVTNLWRTAHPRRTDEDAARDRDSTEK